MVGAVRLHHCADSALLVEVADATAARALGRSLRAAAPPWLVDAVPGLTTLLVEHEPGADPEAVIIAIRDAVPTATTGTPEGRTHAIQVCFEEPVAPDLAGVAAATGRSEAEVVAALCAADLEVALVGHLPGLPYLTGLPWWLAPPRRAAPRHRVPRGAVGVAAGMCCIYPAAAPGGWHLVGETAAELFDPRADPPCLLRPGDRVRLHRVTRDELERLRAGGRPRRSGGPAPARPSVGRARLHVTGGQVVDAGRPGLGRYGVPRGGALDAELWRAANLLAGNAGPAAALEVTAAPVAVTVTAAPAVLAVAGWCAVRVDAGPGTPGRVLAPWRAIRVAPGERLNVRPAGGSIRVYVAVRGGIDGNPVLGSRSALPGGHREPRRDHDAGVTGAADGGLLRLEPPDWLLPASVLRVVGGPQGGVLTEAGWATLAGATWTVSPTSDRRGVRLDGPALELGGAPDVPSQGTPPGAVQVTGAGGPIILLADRGTTGGYAVCATVISADLPLVARLRPGAPVALEVVDRAAASRLRHERQALLATLPGLLHPVEE